MTIDDLHLVDRKAAFPVYSFVSDGLLSPLNVPATYEPGRVIIAGHTDGVTRAIDENVEDRLGPNDIVYVPLYLGENPERVVACDGTHEKLDCYDTNLAFLERIAPKVKGVLVGNAGPELSFKHLCFRPQGSSRENMIDQMCSFVDETSAIIKRAGGTPVYGPVDWDIALDLYFCNGAYRDHCNGRGFIQIVFCGFQLFGLGLDRLPEYPIVPHPSDDTFWQICPVQEGAPWPQLTNYIRGYDYIVSGLEFLSGFRRGTDIVLAEHGFHAGVCGGIEQVGDPGLSE